MNHNENEFTSPEDMDDLLRERSERISILINTAFEHGIDDYDASKDRNTIAVGYYEHSKLRDAFCCGWDSAAAEVQS